MEVLRTERVSECKWAWGKVFLVDMERRTALLESGLRLATLRRETFLRIRLRQQTIADTTIFDAPSSTKKRGGTRDLVMRQAKKGSQWFLETKAHIGMDRG